MQVLSPATMEGIFVCLGTYILISTVIPSVEGCVTLLGKPPQPVPDTPRTLVSCHIPGVILMVWAVVLLFRSSVNPPVYQAWWLCSNLLQKKKKSLSVSQEGCLSCYLLTVTSHESSEPKAVFLVKSKYFIFFPLGFF